MKRPRDRKFIPGAGRAGSLLLAAVGLALLGTTDVCAGTFKEGWYLSRGKANMRIRNYSAAIEAFEKLVEIDPGNREAMQLLGLAYESQGLTDKAIELYDRHLKRFPNDAGIAFRQAQFLEGARFAYRGNDAVRYYRLGLKTRPRSHENRRRLARLLAGNPGTIDEAADEYRILVRDRPRDAALRTEYARLLGARRETVGQAIEQYGILTDQQPTNSIAHRELAAAYAWSGDSDRAIYHAQLALRDDPDDRAANRIRSGLMQGREPLIKSGFTYFGQSGDDRRYDYSGYLATIGGRTEVTPFATLDAAFGFERYGSDQTDVDGTFYNLGLQGRFDPDHRADLEWRYHDFEQAEADSEFLAQYSAGNGPFLITPGIRRAFRYDSLPALTGAADPATGRKIGAARSNTAFCRIGYRGERTEASVMPYAGYVSAESTGNNSLLGADADVKYDFSGDGRFSLSILYKLQFSHYGKDASGFADTAGGPAAGGYFSPDLFINNVLDLEVGYEVRPEGKLVLNAGPSFQYWKGHSDQDESDTGADFDLTYAAKIGSSLQLTAQASYHQIATVYRRHAVTALLAYSF